MIVTPQPTPKTGKTHFVEYILTKMFAMGLPIAYVMTRAQPELVSKMYRRTEE